MANLPTHAFAYDQDFHYYVIYLIIRCRGYDPAVAHQLAGFSQYVDDNAKTEPIYCFASRRAKFHFARSSKDTATTQDDSAVRQRLTQEFREFLNGEGEAKYRVGATLHLLTDTFSHDSFTAYWSRKLNWRPDGSHLILFGHADAAEEGHAPDHPYNDVLKALTAARSVYDLIPERGSGFGVPWDQLSIELNSIFGTQASPANWKDLDRRTAALKALILKLLHEQPSYSKEEFARDRKEFEHAVGL